MDEMDYGISNMGIQCQCDEALKYEFACFRQASKFVFSAISATLQDRQASSYFCHAELGWRHRISDMSRCFVIPSSKKKKLMIRPINIHDIRIHICVIFILHNLSSGIRKFSTQETSSVGRTSKRVEIFDTRTKTWWKMLPKDPNWRPKLPRQPIAARTDVQDETLQFDWFKWKVPV